MNGGAIAKGCASCLSYVRREDEGSHAGLVAILRVTRCGNFFSVMSYGSPRNRANGRVRWLMAR